MTNNDGDVLISTHREEGYNIVRSYRLNGEINSTEVWEKIGQLMDEYAKYGQEVDEDLRLYMFSKIFKDYLIPKTCYIM